MFWLGRALLSRPWLISAAALAVLGLAAGSWWHGYGQGVAAEQARHAAAEARLRAESRRLADELFEAQREQRVEYRDRVRVVQRAPDPSGCADVRVPAGVLDGLPGGAR